MTAVLKREIADQIKSLLIWSVTVGGLGFVCILLYESMQGDMKDMAEAFSNMGAFSDAFGMSTLSIATIKGFFATEVGTVHGLGSGMFAAITAINIISREEDGHTGEFLFSFPLSRMRILAAKALCTALTLVIFTVICTVFYIAGLEILGESIPYDEFFTFMGRQLLMNAEIAGICFGLSSLSGKNRISLGLGVALFFYFYDLVGRVVPDMKDYLFIGPYAYANASEIFIGEETPVGAMVLAVLLLVFAVVFAFWNYDRRDLAA